MMLFQSSGTHPSCGHCSGQPGLKDINVAEWEVKHREYSCVPFPFFQSVIRELKLGLWAVGLNQQNLSR